MQCPKCLKEQSSTTQCDYCGIIFEKYQKKTNYEPNTHLLPPLKENSKGYRGVVVGVTACIIFIAALTVYFTSSKTGLMPVKNSASKNVTDINLATNRESKENKLSTNPNSIKNELLTGFPPKNPIEEARNATVYIETSWGTAGSGFFINGRGNIITNAHVVKADQDAIENASRICNEMKSTITSEITYLRRLKDNPEYYRNSSYRQEVDEKEKLHKTHVDKYERLSALINNASSGAADQIKVVLIDGTELSVLSIQFSTKTDLAMLSVGGIDSPYIKIYDPKKLMQSQKLYTVGNPSGLRFSVTSGIFSGWQNINGIKVLQTDAPINPGNSGGPLLSEDGRVVGVNTAILDSAQNIGFALPIDYVSDEFQPYLTN